MAPRKNMPMTIFSWNGATNDILGLNMYTMPRQRKNRQPEDTREIVVSEKTYVQINVLTLIL